MTPAAMQTLRQVCGITCAHNPSAIIMNSSHSTKCAWTSNTAEVAGYTQAKHLLTTYGPSHGRVALTT